MNFHFSSVSHWPILNAIGRNVRQIIKNFAVLQNGCNALVITNTDEVYAIGTNGEHAPLGTGSTARVLTNVLVKELSGQGLCSILGGNDTHVVAITESGELFSWGKNTYSVIGTEEEIVLRPQLLTMPNTIAMVTIGARHTVVLTTEGIVYSWGDNSEGQLGVGDINATSMPTLVSGGQFDEKAIYIFIGCGLFTSYFVSSNDKVFATGSGQHGALGNGDINSTSEPVLVLLRGNFRMVIGGKYTGYAVTVDGDLYAWGCNEKCQIGNGNSDDQHSPVLVGQFIDVAAHFDCDQAAALDVQGTVHVWGETRFGLVNIPTPTCLTILDDAYTVFLNSRTYRPAINTTAVIIIPTPLEPVVKEIIEEEEGPPELPDFTIWVGSRGGLHIMINLELLVSRSHFFKALYRERLITDETKEVVMLGWSKDIIELYIDFLYDGVINNPLVTIGIINNLFNFAWSYREWNLVYYLIKTFHYKSPLPPDITLSVDNVCFVYEDAMKENKQSICDCCIVFIANHLQEVLVSDEYLYDIDCSTMRSIMQNLAERSFLNAYKELITTQDKRDEDTTCILIYPNVLMYPEEDKEMLLLREISEGQVNIEQLCYRLSKDSHVTKSGSEELPNCFILLPVKIAHLFQQHGRKNHV